MFLMAGQRQVVAVINGEQPSRVLGSAVVPGVRSANGHPAVQGRSGCRVPMATGGLPALYSRSTAVTPALGMPVSGASPALLRVLK